MAPSRQHDFLVRTDILELALRYHFHAVHRVPAKFNLATSVFSNSVRLGRGQRGS